MRLPLVSALAVLLALWSASLVGAGLGSHPAMVMLDGEALHVEQEELGGRGVLERHRRYLLYRPMSLFQFTYAYSLPIELMPRRMLLIVLGGQIAFDLPSKLSQLTVQDVARDGAHLPQSDVFRAAEAILDQSGIPGRACMLLCVCQLAETPMNRESGLLEDIIHIMLSPSEGSHADDWASTEERRVYMEAEETGSKRITDCRDAYPDCNVSLIDAITKVMFS